MPDKGAVVEAFGVLFKKAIPQPHGQTFACAIGLGQQFVQYAGCPTARGDGFPCVYQQGQQALMGWLFATHRW